MSKIRKINKEIVEVNRKIAFYGRRLECPFGLFSHYGYLAKHPEFSKRFQGREFILKELDNMEMIHAEFNAMIEEGMKMSMEDMEDLMEEMREKVREFKKQKGIEDPFDELNKDLQEEREGWGLRRFLTEFPKGDFRSATGHQDVGYAHLVGSQERVH